MKTQFDDRYKLSFHSRHFGEASPRARLMYSVLLILLMLTILISNRISSPTHYLNTSETPATIKVAKQAFTKLCRLP